MIPSTSSDQRAPVAQNDSSLAIVLRNTDVALSRIVTDRMPIGTYTSVNVRTISYSFSGLHSSGIETRLISLAVSKAKKCTAFFKAFFSGLGLIEYRGLNQDIDQSALQDQILNHMCDTPDDSSEIQNAYERCTDVDLFIATDLSAIEMKLRESEVVLGAFSVGQQAKEISGVVWPVLREIVIPQILHHRGLINH